MLLGNVRNEKRFYQACQVMSDNIRTRHFLKLSDSAASGSGHEHSEKKTYAHDFITTMYRNEESTIAGNRKRPE